MDDRLKRAFEPICATEEMKNNASAFVRRELARRQRKNRRPLQYAMACCIALFLMIGGIGGYSFYTAPVSYISVDINPSVELGLNRFDRVVSAEAYNDDGAQILQNLNLKHKPYTEAIELLLANETVEGYLSEDRLLTFTVVSEREEALLAGIQQCHGYAQAGGQCHSAGQELVEEAHHNGLSFGKYQAYLELSQHDDTITVEDCKDLSMLQIRTLIDRYADGEEVVELPSGDGHHGNGQGHGGGSGHRGDRE